MLINIWNICEISNKLKTYQCENDQHISNHRKHENNTVERYLYPASFEPIITGLPISLRVENPCVSTFIEQDRKRV